MLDQQSVGKKEGDDAAKRLVNTRARTTAGRISPPHSIRAPGVCGNNQIRTRDDCTPTPKMQRGHKTRTSPPQREIFSAVCLKKKSRDIILDVHQLWAWQFANKLGRTDNRMDFSLSKSPELSIAEDATERHGAVGLLLGWPSCQSVLSYKDSTDARGRDGRG